MSSPFLFWILYVFGCGFRTPAVVVVSDVYKGKTDRRKDGAKKTDRQTDRQADKQTNRREEGDEGGYKGQQLAMWLLFWLHINHNFFIVTQVLVIVFVWRLSSAN